MDRFQLPDCCRSCPYCGWDSQDEYSPIWYYCEAGVMFPVRKGSCKRKDAALAKEKRGK